MIQLEPGEYFAIVRQLPDPNDSTQYYVRAEIRNARSDALIERVALTDRGSRRHSKEWQVTNVVTPAGFYISILTTVYTDAAMTQKSDTYAEEMETFLVETRQKSFGGGGPGISYKKVKEIMEEVVATIKPGISRDQLSYDVGKVLDAMVTKKDIEGIVGAGIKGIEFPDAVDLKPVLSLIESKEYSPKITVPAIDVKPIVEAVSKGAADAAFDGAKLGVKEATPDAQEIAKSIIEWLADAKGIGEKIGEFIVEKARGGLNEFGSLFGTAMQKTPKEEEPVLSPFADMDDGALIRHALEKTGKQ